jgi:lipoic acid synthetase
MREHIVPCGIGDRPVTSLAEEGLDVSVEQVVDVVAGLAAERWAGGSAERQDVAWRHRPDDLSRFSRGEGPGERGRVASRLAEAGVTAGLTIESRKPAWLRPMVKHGQDVLALRRTLRDLDLVTVCEDAGCPNLSECWSDGTATFMVLGDRCTRACGFCLVDTRKPAAPDGEEPARVAEAVDRMGLDHVVLTMVARDDLRDGGMGHVAACVEAVRFRRPSARIETLISDAKGDAESLDVLFAVRPDVLNHNIESVARLQRAVRPSAGYARSLSVLALAKAAGLVTKSSLIVGMGETDDEVIGCLADLAGIGVDIVTIGQYLRPTSHHLPVARWVEPADFTRWKALGEQLGIGHVEASPLTRSSYHAKAAAEHAAAVRVG